MNDLLEVGKRVKTHHGYDCSVEAFLGNGSQGEVYKAVVDHNDFALKWYFPRMATKQQKNTLSKLIKKGPPNSKFLWPVELAQSSDNKGFGYLMPLRPAHYKNIADIMTRRVEPSFKSLAIAGFQLADSFLQLHMMGMCYKDISFGNIFLDPDFGEILICDNDNVDIDDKNINTDILGTPRFMAPEVVRGEENPSTKTDLFSLAILLFYIFMMSHPLEGKKEAEIRCFDYPAMVKLYGTDPLFVFDPLNDSNRPVYGLHDNAIDFWEIYPEFLKSLFMKAFTDGIKDPVNGRVRESEWRSAMVRLKDSIIYCGCGAENFYDVSDISNQRTYRCWLCNQKMQIPPKLKIDNNIIMLNYDTEIFPHHIDDERMYDFSEPVAVVNKHPSKPDLWGLKNLGDQKWIGKLSSGKILEINPGNSITIASGTKINFGKYEGEIL